MASQTHDNVLSSNSTLKLATVQDWVRKYDPKKNWLEYEVNKECQVFKWLYVKSWTTIGISLAEQLNSVFRDADSFHTDENKKKMASGMPLTDEDRLPWLFAIHDFLTGFHTTGQTVVITCSALKKVYRQILRYGKQYNNIQEIGETKNLPIPFKLVYLKGEEAVLRDRMQKRTGHFMSSGMLSSQLVTMEEPDNTEECLIIDIRESVNTIVKNILQTS